MNKKLNYIAGFLFLAAPLHACAMDHEEAGKLAAEAGLDGDLAALTKLKSAAQEGNSNAQAFLGNYYILQKNCKKGISWIRKSAAQNNAYGDDILASTYSYGDCVTKNPRKAFYWTKKAAQPGHPIMEYILGRDYAKGIDTKVNYNDAIYWYKLSAKQGYLPAKFELILIKNGTTHKKVGEAMRSQKLRTTLKPSSVDLDDAAKVNDSKASRNTSSHIKFVVFHKFLVPLSMIKLGYSYSSGRGADGSYYRVLKGYEGGFISFDSEPAAQSVVWADAVKYLPFEHIPNYWKKIIAPVKRVDGEHYVRLSKTVTAISYKNGNRSIVNGVIWFVHQGHDEYSFQDVLFSDKSEPHWVATKVLNYELSHDKIQY